MDLQVSLSVLNDQPGVHQRIIETGPHQKIIVFFVRQIYLAINHALSEKYVSAGVSKRAWGALRAHAIIYSEIFGFLILESNRDRYPVSLCQNTLIVNREAKKEASSV